jgi:putative methanogenesis marker protein 6
MLQQNNHPDTEFCHIPMGDGTERESDQKGKINRMVILGPECKVSSKELLSFLHMQELPLNIRLTCYGANINGYPENVLKATSAVRKLDPAHIFIKFRGFPPGDPRRCRAKRGGAREGFHQLEAEYRLLPDVSYALEHPERVEQTEQLDLITSGKMDVNELVDIIKEVEEKDI